MMKFSFRFVEPAHCGLADGARSRRRHQSESAGGIILDKEQELRREVRF